METCSANIVSISHMNLTPSFSPHIITLNMLVEINLGIFTLCFRLYIRPKIPPLSQYVYTLMHMPHLLKLLTNHLLIYVRILLKNKQHIKPMIFSSESDFFLSLSLPYSPFQSRICFANFASNSLTVMKLLKFVQKCLCTN